MVFLLGLLIAVAASEIGTAEAQPVQLSEPQLYELLDESPWPAWTHPQVVRLARCESGLNPWAGGDSGVSLGLMQIHTPAHPYKAARYNLYDPAQNLAAAHEVWSERQRWGISGWTAWSWCYFNG